MLQQRGYTDQGPAIAPRSLTRRLRPRIGKMGSLFQYDMSLKEEVVSNEKRARRGRSKGVGIIGW